MPHQMAIVVEVVEMIDGAEAVRSTFRDAASAIAHLIAITDAPAPSQPKRKASTRARRGRGR